MKNEVEQLAAKEEHVQYKKLSQEIFCYDFNFSERYGTDTGF